MSGPHDNLCKLIQIHLQENNIFKEDQPWKIETSALAGRGVFAVRDINPGELIFIDHALVLGPRSGIDRPIKCVTCYSSNNLALCSKGCGLTVCGSSCEQSKFHKKECDLIQTWKNGCGNFDITRCLTPIRSLFLSESQRDLVRNLQYHPGKHHGFEVKLLKKLGLKFSKDEEELMSLTCHVLDANAFEVLVGDESMQTSLRGLFPLAGLVNHRCYANAMHIFDDKQRMIVKAATFIAKGEEIFHTYSRLTWNTFTRRFYLCRTKNFGCNCDRCVDPSEFGTNLSAIFCECRGLVLPKTPLDMKTRWICNQCDKKYENSHISFVISAFGSRLGSFKNNDVEDMISFIDKQLIPTCNQIIVEIKLKIVWNLGCNEGFLWTELTDRLLQIKEDYCTDLLALVEQLRLGKCKLRALLLYERYCCFKEKCRRYGLEHSALEINNNCKISQEYVKQMNDDIKEASDILEEDVSAPEELKALLYKS